MVTHGTVAPGIASLVQTIRESGKMGAKFWLTDREAAEAIQEYIASITTASVGEAVAGDAEELEILIREYNPMNSDWNFRKGVMLNVLSRLRPPDIAATPTEGWRCVPAEPTTAQHIAAMEFALAHMRAHGVTSLSPFKDYPPLRETTAGMYRAMVCAVGGSAAQAGWKPLPIDPTPEMISAGMGEIPEDGAEYEDVEAAYRAMVAAAVSSTQRACQVCGETSDLKCGPSRFGAETWACKDCWEPEGPTVPSPNHGGAT